MTAENILIIAAGAAVAIAVGTVLDYLRDRQPNLPMVVDTPYDAPPMVRDCGDCGWPVNEADATVVVDAAGAVEWWHESCAERQVDDELEHLAHYDGLPRDRGDA